jgi:hypothetical protein
MKALLWTISWVWMSVAGFTGIGFADVPYDEPVLALRVVDQAGTPLEILEDAMAHVGRIFQSAGIRTAWVGPSVQKPASYREARIKTLELTVVLVSEDVARAMCPQETVTGLALSNNGRGARRAYVFAGRVINEAERSLNQVQFLNRPKAWGLILGHVVAHEIGHLMLPHDSHVSSGIMRGRFEVRNVEEAVRGQYLFSQMQATVIRTALMSEAVEW